MDFLLENRVRILLYLATALAGVMIGRGCAPPPRVEVVERWRERDEGAARDASTTTTRTAPSERVRVVREFSPVAEAAPCAERPIIRETLEVERPGGGVTVTTRSVDAPFVREREREKSITAPAPGLRAGLMAGVQLLPLAWPPAPVLVGAHVEARLGGGPLWLGAWGMVSTTDPLRRAEVGITLSIELP